MPAISESPLPSSRARYSSPASQALPIISPSRSFKISLFGILGCLLKYCKWDMDTSL